MPGEVSTPLLAPVPWGSQVPGHLSFKLSSPGTAFAVGADWTPLAGEVTISKDGSAEVNVVNLPEYISGVVWEWIPGPDELKASNILLHVNAAALTEQVFILSTFISESIHMLQDIVFPGNAYQVSALGSDVTGSGRKHSPFATIQHAHDVAEPGETIFIVDALSVSVQQLITKDGIAIRGSRNALISTASLGDFMIDIVADNCTVEGVKFENDEVDGGAVVVDGNDFLMQDCRIDTRGDALRVAGRHNVLRRLRVSSIEGGSAVRIASTGASETKPVSISDCNISDISGAGIELNPSPLTIKGVNISGCFLKECAVGIQVDGNVENTTVTGCVFSHNAIDITDSGTDTLVFGNHPDGWDPGGVQDAVLTTITDDWSTAPAGALTTTLNANAAALIPIGVDTAVNAGNAAALVPIGADTAKMSADWAASPDLDGQLTDLLVIAATATGTGPFLITVKVVDDVLAPLQTAAVRLVDASIVSFVGDTDASGEIVFSLENGVFDVAISRSGYSFGSGVLTVAGADDSFQFQMLPSTVIPPPPPELSSWVVFTLDEQNNPQAGVTVQVQITQPPTGAQDLAHSQTVQTVFSNPSGEAIFSLVRGAQYQVRRGNGKWRTGIRAADGPLTNAFSIIGVDEINVLP